MTTHLSAAVLLSTYNGQYFLRQQLDTILNQPLRDIILIVRDDGSTDDTLTILDERAEKDHRVIVQRGANIGVVASFLALVRSGVEHGAPVLFFADQDDIWRSDKIGAMVASLASRDPVRPALHYSNIRLVDAAGAPLARQLPSRPVPQFGQAITQGFAHGCCMAFNLALARLISDPPPDPRRLVMHDIWTMMVATAFGDVSRTAERHIDYRQHGRNVVGGRTGLALAAARARRILRRKEAIGRFALQAREFRRMFGDRLAPGHLRVLDRFIQAATGSLPSRMAAVCSRGFSRSGLTEDLLFRLVLVAGALRTTRPQGGG